MKSTSLRRTLLSGLAEVLARPSLDISRSGTYVQPSARLSVRPPRPAPPRGPRPDQARPTFAASAMLSFFARGKYSSGMDVAARCWRPHQEDK